MSNKLLNIQALRFIAAFMVVLYHTNGHYKASGGTWLFQYFSGGWIGVDIFFVISGYIMWFTTQNAKPSLNYSATFIFKRFIRVYSGFIPWGCAALLILYIFAPKRIEDINLVSSFLLIPQAIKTNFLPVTWTLSYELLFYILFSVLLLFPKKLFVPIIISLVAILLSFGITSYSAGYFLLSPLILEFLFGVLIGIYFSGSPKDSYPWLALIISLFCFTIAIFSVSEGERLARVLTAGIGSASLIYCAVSLEKTIKAPQWCVTIGDASYALYLCHMPILSVVRWTLREKFALHPELYYLMTVAFCVLVSVIWYRLYERPAYIFLSKLINIFPVGIYRAKQA